MASAASAAVPLSTYVEARAAEMNGDETRSAQLFAMMAAADPDDHMIARRAISTAIQSGQSTLAISLARKVPAALAVTVAVLLAVTVAVDCP